MDPKTLQPKQISPKEKALREAMVEDDIDYETEEEVTGGGGLGGGELGITENEKKKKGAAVHGRGRSSGSVSPPSCQAHNCATDLSESKRYHRRHKVCEFHSKAAVVMVAGIRQRFCQQCSRFHELSEFDEAKRSCRRRLAGHNERRRKSGGEWQGEGGSQQAKEGHCRQLVNDQRSRIQMTPPTSCSGGYKHLHIR